MADPTIEQIEQHGEDCYQPLAAAAALAGSLVQLRIEEHAKDPAADRDALPPIHALVLAPGTPPRILAPAATATA